MSHLDITAVVAELRPMLLGARVEKIFHTPPDLFRFKLHHPEHGRVDLVVEPGKRVHTTSYEYKAPSTPTNIAMYLRKRLKNTRLEGIEQVGYDRIIKLVFTGYEKVYNLYIEVFSRGNLVLTDGDDKILRVFRVEEWRTRTLKPDHQYLPPPSNLDPKNLTPEKIVETLGEQGRKEVVRAVATDLGLGGKYAEEVLLRAGIEGKRSSETLTKLEWEKLCETIRDIFIRAEKGETNPELVLSQDGKPLDVTPFHLQIYDNLSRRRYKHLVEALDDYFSTTREEPEKKTIEEETKKIKIKEEKQIKTIKKYYENAESFRKKAEKIYLNIEKIGKTLEEIRRIIERNGWGFLADNPGSVATLPVECVDPANKKVEIRVDDTTIPLDPNLSPGENADNLYQEAKKFDKKVLGAKKALLTTREQLSSVVQTPQTFSPPRPRKPVYRRRWYEKFRWFRTSNNLLVVAGRDKHTNTTLVKKHMEPKDIYIHAQIHGAPSTIIKTDGGEVTGQDIEEAAIFACSNSRAWREGLLAADTYWVHPDQVTQTPRAGETLAPGSFVIRGKRNYIKNVKLELGVGLVKLPEEEVQEPDPGYRVVCAPITAIRKHSDKYLVIRPGKTRKSELAKVIHQKLVPDKLKQDITLDMIISVLPPGGSDITQEPKPTGRNR